MLKLMLACCKIYISESRNVQALEAIQQAAGLHPQVVITNIFKDELYNRVGCTLVSSVSPSTPTDVSPLKRVALSVVKTALEAIDLRKHSGLHPRLGVVDHICFHPLEQTSVEQASGLARSLASDIGQTLQVPTFLYGEAHEGRRSLDSLRRELGYFTPNSSGSLWSGGLHSELLKLDPEFGPRQASRLKGIVVVGATPWVDNYNIPVMSGDLDAVRRVARRISGRGGGLETVQAMGLGRGEGSCEVACNLLDPGNVGAVAVQAEVRRLAGQMGMEVGEGYFTDFSREKVVEIFFKYMEAEGL